MAEKILRRDQVRIKEIPRDQSNSDFQRYSNIPSIPNIKSGFVEKTINPSQTTFAEATIDSSTTADFGNNIDFVFVEGVSEIPTTDDGWKIQMSANNSTWYDISHILYTGQSWGSSIKKASDVYVRAIGSSASPVDLLVLYGDWL